MIKKGLEEYLEDADEAASRASEISRNLGLGAIAVIWIFKNPETSSVLLPDKILTWALFWAVCSLSLDLLHYIFRAIFLYKLYHTKEALYDAGKLSEEQISDVHAPRYIRVFAWVFWIAKITSIVIAYSLISIFLMSKL